MNTNSTVYIYDKIPKDTRAPDEGILCPSIDLLVTYKREMSREKQISNGDTGVCMVYIDVISIIQKRKLDADY